MSHGGVNVLTMRFPTLVSLVVMIAVAVSLAQLALLLFLQGFQEAVTAGPNRR